MAPRALAVLADNVSVCLSFSVSHTDIYIIFAVAVEKADGGIYNIDVYSYHCMVTSSEEDEGEKEWGKSALKAVKKNLNRYRQAGLDEKQRKKQALYIKTYLGQCDAVEHMMKRKIVHKGWYTSSRIRRKVQLDNIREKYPADHMLDEPTCL